MDQLTTGLEPVVGRGRGPADIAAVARLPLFAESRRITGQVFSVEGGMSTLRA